MHRVESLGSVSLESHPEKALEILLEGPSPVLYEGQVAVVRPQLRFLAREPRQGRSQVVPLHEGFHLRVHPRSGRRSLIGQVQGPRPISDVVLRLL